MYFDRHVMDMAALNFILSIALPIVVIVILEIFEQAMDAWANSSDTETESKEEAIEVSEENWEV